MKLLATLRRELRAVADAERAQQQQRYMKSDLPYHGVTSPLLRQILRRVLPAWPLDDAAGWRRDVLALWRAAEFREERYAAIALSGDRRARAWQRFDVLPMYREIIVSGAWWDYVDDVASHRVGPLLVADPERMKPELLRWSVADDIWLRRTSIICQLHVKQSDLDLLYGCIEPSLASREFFLRKAIGWSLRQLAWSDPDEVVRYVKRNRARLSGLSKREALKNLLKDGTVEAIP